jgi:hypothetical protein
MLGQIWSDYVRLVQIITGYFSLGQVCQIRSGYFGLCQFRSDYDMLGQVQSR